MCSSHLTAISIHKFSLPWLRKSTMSTRCRLIFALDPEQKAHHYPLLKWFPRTWRSWFVRLKSQWHGLWLSVGSDPAFAGDHLLWKVKPHMVVWGFLLPFSKQLWGVPRVGVTSSLPTTAECHSYPEARRGGVDWDLRYPAWSLILHNIVMRSGFIFSF